MKHAEVDFCCLLTLPLCPLFAGSISHDASSKKGMLERIVVWCVWLTHRLMAQNDGWFACLSCLMPGFTCVVLAMKGGCEWGGMTKDIGEKAAV